MKWISIVLFFCLSSCISGPKDPKQSFSEKLSEDSYSSGHIIGPVPVLTRTRVVRKISGRVLCGDGFAQQPVNGATVRLVEGRKILDSAQTDREGNYRVMAQLMTETPYQLNVESACGTSSETISLDVKEKVGHDIVIKK